MPCEPPKDFVVGTFAWTLTVTYGLMLGHVCMAAMQNAGFARKLIVLVFWGLSIFLALISLSDLLLAQMCVDHTRGVFLTMLMACMAGASRDARELIV